ncbi:10000_t:CDS:2 [Funneliformis geosporum]|uniref:16313_t:CDS:1 n=1 Tax=Funneliformis geosporum TaxID=1117311 RepID=A0A9W4SWM2_9GLOM|nr:16313_t:CDS:2 [Funneliformis geosporum]CAI2184143.1 10000_t:CDS:2 [Funneliformis geosporum]
MPYYFILPDSKPKWTIDIFMSSLLNDNIFDLSGKNLIILVKMIENESDHFHIVKFLNIEIQIVGLQKDYIYYDIIEKSYGMQLDVLLDGTV